MIEHRPLLLDLAYRITGDAREAEDIVQDTFERALTRPPADTTRPWRPWLVRVATNLARDRLRQRRRRAYLGPWLPTPVPAPTNPAEQRDAVSWATLVALEVLSPQQRAVLVLRDVADLDPTEVAEILGSRPDAVRATHSRARRALAKATPAEPVDLDPQMQQAMVRLATAILSGDLAGLQAALTDDAVFLSDANGAYAAAINPVRGPSSVARLLLGLRDKGGPQAIHLMRLNDRIAWHLHRPEARGRYAEHSVILLTLAADGRVAAIHSLLAPGKLDGVHTLFPKGR